jgi:TolB protein
LTNPSLLLRAAGLGCLVFAISAEAQVPVLEISGANFRPMPLAVAAPQSQEPNARSKSAEFDATLVFDLSASGIFQVLDRKSFLADPSEGVTASSINFGRWANVGADGLVKTQLSSEGDQIRADLHFFGVGTGKEEFKLTHTAAGRDVRRLAHFLANAIYRSLTREPGPFESHLACVRKTAQGKEVWVSDWDGRNGQMVAGGPNVLNVLPALMADSSGVAFTTYRTGKPMIFVQRFGSGAVPLVKSEHMATGVAFSPDGKRIAYSLAGAESTQIWVAHADGSGARQLTDTPYFINTSPSWAPDGKRIAFVSNQGGSPQIYLMNADGSGVRRLTFQGNYNQTPDWSPRGDLIAFTARDERRAFDLFTVNVDTGKITRLTQDQGDNEEPTFSPNGRLLIFSSQRTGTSRLFVMNADGSNQLPLPMESGAYSTPDWGR